MWHKRKTREVLVVGAGPVGKWTALLLAERGIDVGVIDERSDGERALEVILHPATLQLLDQEGLAGEVVAAGRRISRLELCDRTGCREVMDLSVLSGPHPYALTLDARAFGEILERRLKRLGAPIEWETRCAGIESGDRSVRTELEGLEEITTGYAIPHREWEVARAYGLDSAFVIGADGAYSLVRRRMHLPVMELGTSRFAVFEGRGGGGDALKVVLHDDGPSVLWPLSGDRWRWVMELPPRDAPDPLLRRGDLVPALGGWAVGSLDPEALTFLLERRAPWLAQPEIVPEIGFELFTERRVVERLGSDRVWLAGDAAHLGGPLAGDSLNLGLKESHDLAWRLAWILRGRAGLELLSGLDREWDREWRTRQTTSLGGCLPVTGMDLGRLLAHAGV